MATTATSAKGPASGSSERRRRLARRKHRHVVRITAPLRIPAPRW